MFKKLILAVICCIGICSSYAQSATEWQSDLRHLQNTVHEKYSNLFYNISESDWDKVVEDFYKQIPGMNKTEILAGFIKLMALFHIGHTQMNTFGLHGSSGNLQLHRFPFQLYWFSDGIYILRADKKYEQAVGGKITHIGKTNIEDAVEAVRPLVSYENEQGFKSNSVFYLAIPELLKTQGIAKNTDEISVSYLKNGKTETTIFKADSNNNIFSMTGLETPAGWSVAQKVGDLPLWQKEPTAFRYMQYLPDTKTLYVRHSVTMDDGDKTIAGFFKTMVDFIDNNNVQKLILDIRMNGGGNNNLNKAIVTSIIEARKINEHGKFFCIIGRRTFSAAQNLVNELEKYTEVIFAGEPTSENVNFYGDTKTEILPATGLEANLSWMWWQNLAATDKRKATLPKLSVDMSFTDYYNNDDPVINVINAYDSQAAIELKLRNLVDAEKYDSALAEVEEYLKDPLHQYFKNEIETKINSYGYSFIKNSKIEIANKVFNINIQLFPESANAYDSFAESLMYLGRNADAIKYYQMAVAKDKSGITAENSKKMIEKIKSGN